MLPMAWIMMLSHRQLFSLFSQDKKIIINGKGNRDVAFGYHLNTIIGIFFEKQRSG